MKVKPPPRRYGRGFEKIIMITIKTIAENTGLKEWQVRYRLVKLGIKGRQVHARCFVFPKSAIDAVRAFKK